MKFKPIKKPSGVTVKPGSKNTQVLPLLFGKLLATPPEFKLEKILVPLDFTGCSEKALAYAIPFARQFDAELTLLHVVQPSMPAADMPILVEGEPVEDAQKNLDAIQRKLSGLLRSTTVVRVGSPHHEIIEVTKELEVDLIILSTHGRTGLGRVLLGSTAEKVVRHAGCPVLIVRQNEHEFVAGSLLGLQACRMSEETTAETESAKP